MTTLERYEELMRQGHAHLQKGHYDDAQLTFENATAFFYHDSALQAPAYQMAGIAARLKGDLASADSLLTVATQFAEDTTDPCLQGRIYRDHGAVEHLVWLNALRYRGARKSDKVASYYEEARDRFEHSYRLLESALLECNMVASELRLHTVDRPELSAAIDQHEARRIELATELQVTQGFLGSLLRDGGEHKEAYLRLREADEFFQMLEGHDRKPVYEANNLIRYLRVLPFWKRPQHLRRALWLTSKRSPSPGARKKVYVALLGNQVYNLLQILRLP